MQEPAADRNRVIVVHGNKVETVVSDLQFYSNYTLTVAPFNSKGDGPHSKAYHFSTPEGGKVTFYSACETSMNVDLDQLNLCSSGIQLLDRFHP